MPAIPPLITPLGAQSPPPDNGFPMFPHDLVTGFLVPNFGTKPKARQKVLLAVTEDGTRTGRVKSGTIYGFELVYKARPKAEYDALMEFWLVQSYMNYFNYYDKWQDRWYTLCFDSEIEAEYSSFDSIDFSVTVTN